MFFVNNVYEGREPYHVQAIEKDKKDQQGSSGRQFGENDADAHQKFLKASEKLYKKKSVVVASEIMNKQLTELEEKLSLEEAWEKIQHHDVKHFPIVSSEGKFQGMLSEGELLRHLQTKKKLTLKDVMAKHTLCAEPSTELSEVIQVFSNEKIEAVPVIDEQEKIVGILTQNELLQTVIKTTIIDRATCKNPG